MRERARSLPWAALKRLRSEAALTLVETLVASVILIVGALATFVLVDTANSTTSASRAREGATNIAREVLEDARANGFTQIGQQDWFTPELQGLSGGSGTVSTVGTFTSRTTVTRRAFTYTVDVTPCAVDDNRDGYGSHDVATNWCSDSTTTGTADSQPMDMKRVNTTISWTFKGTTQSVTETATFGSSGVAIGPATGSLAIKNTVPASTLSGSPPTITSASTTAVVFRGTSTGAADMKFTVNGAEQQTNIVANGNGTWDYTWSLSGLPDGTYTIGAVAIDALGVRGQPYTIQVVLNRNVPSAPQNIAIGYNYINVTGTKTLVVESSWDAAPDGNVTGYEVLRGTTSVCGGQSSQATTCIDFSPPTSGTTTYTFKTWYRDGAGNMQSVSSTAQVTAPGATSWPQSWAMGTSTANIGTNCLGTTTQPTNTLQTDLVSTFPTSTTSVIYPGNTGTANYVWACLPPFPTDGYKLNSGNATATLWYKNPSGSCSIFWYVMLGQSTFLAGGTSQTPIALSTGDTVAKSYTSSHATTPTTFTAGQQLALYFGVHNAVSKNGTCQTDQLYYGSTNTQITLSLPISAPGGGSTLAQPSPPTALTATRNTDGTTTLTWTGASGTPAPDFYRIYRDGQNYTNRVDTVGDSGQSTQYTWTDTNVGSTTHTYYVTTATSSLTESATMAGPVTG